MIRLGLIYLAVVIVSIGMITGVPFKIYDSVTGKVAAAAPPEMAPAVETVAAVVAAAEQAPPSQPSAGLEQITAAILADLSNAAAQPDTPAADDALTAMTNAALASLQGLPKPAAPQDSSLQSLVAQALQEGQSNADIDALVNQAADAGTVTVPHELMTSDGNVDTAVLLASIVAQEEGVAMGEGDASSFDDTIQSDPALRFLQTQDMLYEVEPGDSLGGLALRFYGDSGFYPVIYSANTTTLGGSDRIKVGQRLVIPARNKL